MQTLYLLVLALSIPSAFTFPAQESAQHFPEGIVKEDMSKAESNFNRAFGDFAQIIKISDLGIVENPAQTVDEMMKTGVLLSAGNADVRPTILRLDLSTLTREERFYLRDSLLRNVSRGDIKIEVTLTERRSGSNYVTVNSISEDGNRFSGIFLGSARIPGGLTTSMRHPNTVCETRVLTSYLWGSPAETAVGCVRAMCEGDKCVDCVVKSSSAFGGFFGDAKIEPSAGKPGRITSAKCCEAYFNYTWVTGFKKIKLSVEKVSLEVEGRLGQSGNGSFTVTECCDMPVSQ